MADNQVDWKNKNQIHWESMLMAIDTESLREYSGLITKTVYDANSLMLLMSVKRDADNLESQILFAYYPLECYLNKQPVEGETPDSIQKLCEDFQTQNPRDLVGAKVDGVYFMDKLVGIRKR